MQRLLQGLRLGATALFLQGWAALAQDQVSLRLGDKEVPLSAALSARLADLGREALRRCGPNSIEHPHNFGRAAAEAPQRWKRTLAASRLHVMYAEPFDSLSELGGRRPVSEIVLGLEDGELFVGPDFSRHAGVVTEHLSCGYLASLELACLAELAPHLPARYREACASLERDAAGRIIMPPPDIAPACS
jgi:hypothetical protein